MTRFLNDTNVVSEMVRREPEPHVIEFLGSGSESAISVVTVHELWFGVLSLGDAQRRRRLTDWLGDLLSSGAGDVLPVDQSVARAAAVFRTRRQQMGRPVNMADSLIAATASVHGLTLATRNVRDFEGLDLDIHNPWEGA